MNTDTFVEHYVAVWNEPDADAREQLVSELWAENGIEYTDENSHQGHAALLQRIAGAYEQFVAGGEFVFRLGERPATHHDAIAFSVEMAPAGGGEAGWSATIFATLDADQRITSDYQFGRDRS